MKSEPVGSVKKNIRVFVEQLSMKLLKRLNPRLIAWTCFRGVFVSLQARSSSLGLLFSLKMQKKHSILESVRMQFLSVKKAVSGSCYIQVSTLRNWGKRIFAENALETITIFGISYSNSFQHILLETRFSMNHKPGCWWLDYNRKHCSTLPSRQSSGISHRPKIN